MTAPTNAWWAVPCPLLLLLLLGCPGIEDSTPTLGRLPRVPAVAPPPFHHVLAAADTRATAAAGVAMLLVSGATMGAASIESGIAAMIAS